MESAHMKVILFRTINEMLAHFREVEGRIIQVSFLLSYSDITRGAPSTATPYDRQKEGLLVKAGEPLFTVQVRELRFLEKETEEWIDPIWLVVPITIKGKYHDARIAEFVTASGQEALQFCVYGHSRNLKTGEWQPLDYHLAAVKPSLQRPGE